MEANQRPWEADGTGVVWFEIERQALPALERAEVSLIAAAHRLVDEFRTQRRSIHDALKAQPGQAAPYSPMQLFARHHRGTLQIYWQTVDIGKNGGRVYRYIRKGAKTGKRGKGYDMSMLRKKAGYAADLVEQYEAMAEKQRQTWAKLQAAKMALYGAVRDLPEHASDVEPQPGNAPGLIPRSPNSLDHPEISL